MDTLYLVPHHSSTSFTARGQPGLRSIALFRLGAPSRRTAVRRARGNWVGAPMGLAQTKHRCFLTSVRERSKTPKGGRKPLAE